MKIVHTGDWHLGKVLNGYSLIEDQRRWLSDFLIALERERPDVLLIAGDVFDRGVPPAAAITLLGDTLHALRELRIAVMMISGNHDAGERLEFASSLLAPAGVYIAGSLRAEIQKVTLHDQHGAVHFYLLPHSDRYLLRQFFHNVQKPDASSKDSLSDLLHTFCRPMLDTLDRSARNVLMAHGFFAAAAHDLEYNGVSVGGSEKVDLTPFATFDYIALGHLHSAKGTGLSWAQYAGSPIKFSIAEAGQKKSCFILSLEQKGMITQTTLTVPPPRDLRVLTGSFSDLLAQGIDTPLEDYVFFELTDPMPITDVVMRLKPYYPHILGISFLHIADMMPDAAQSGIVPQSKLAAHSPQELFALFYQQSTDSPLTPLQQKLIADIE